MAILCPSPNFTFQVLSIRRNWKQQCNRLVLKPKIKQFIKWLLISTKTEAVTSTSTNSLTWWRQKWCVDRYQPWKQSHRPACYHPRISSFLLPHPTLCTYWLIWLSHSSHPTLLVSHSSHTCLTVDLLFLARLHGVTHRAIRTPRKISRRCSTFSTTTKPGKYHYAIWNEWQRNWARLWVVSGRVLVVACCVDVSAHEDVWQFHPLSSSPLFPPFYCRCGATWNDRTSWYGRWRRD